MIKFGTDGWRGIIAKDFTYDNLSLVALATAQYIKKNNKNQKRRKLPAVVIGYDTRFLSKEFATEVALILASEGIIVHLTDNVSSTPQVSFHTKQKGADIGIVITASHNPPQYNGFKLKANFGGPATPQQIEAVEFELSELMKMKKTPQIKYETLDRYIANRKIRMLAAEDSYVRTIRKKIDVEAIREANLRILYDPMYGAGMNTLKHLLPDIEEIHNEINPLFGEIHHPEPILENLYPLKERVVEGKFDIGIATDGDADRVGLIDDTGEFVDSHRLFMILMKYLCEFKKKRGTVVKTVSLTSMVDKYCKKKSLNLIETPVGFKYSAEIMAKEDVRVLIGGEESGGLGTILHIPERDGIFNAILLLEAMIVQNKTLRQLCEELEVEFGPHRFMRRDEIVTLSQKNAILTNAEKLIAAANDGKGKLIKEDIIATSTKDGYKFFIENGWLLIRASGTEPLVRFYAEADSISKVTELIEEGIKLAKR